MRISELLRYVFGKYGQIPLDRSVVLSFNDGTEALSAKELLFKCVGDLKLDGSPRCVSRRRSDDKSRLDTEDLLGVMIFAGRRGAIDLLPKFVAANLERVPALQSDVLNLCLAANRVAVLDSKIIQHHLLHL